MTPVSRWKLSEKEEERIKSLYIDKLTVIVDKNEMREFVKTLFSETELLMISKRMIAILLIDMGKTDVEVGKLLHVTRATANRFRNSYKFGRDKLEVKKIVDELKKNKEVNEFLTRLKEYLLTAPSGRIPKKSIF